MVPLQQNIDFFIRNIKNDGLFVINIEEIRKILRKFNQNIDYENYSNKIKLSYKFSSLKRWFVKNKF